MNILARHVVPTYACHAIKCQNVKMRNSTIKICPIQITFDFECWDIRKSQYDLSLKINCRTNEKT